ncbi:RDD family protein [Mycolicibacterium sp. CBM1]
MAREIGSWLSGPEPVQPAVDGDYPGQALGLPEAGPQSLAGTGRRFAALLIDWLIAYGLAALGITLGIVTMATLSTAVLLIWFLLGVISVRLFTFTPGQYALGLMVVPVDNRIHVGTGRAIVRGLLLALVIPALFSDADGRGLQDRLTATAVVRR